MGFLDDLFGNSKYLNSKEKQSKTSEAAPQKVSENNVSVPQEPLRMNEAAPQKPEIPNINVERPAAAKPAEVPVISRPATGNDPDLPVPFGYKCNWLCVKASSPLEVIEKLELKNPEPSNWDKGIEMAYNGYRFVSPVLDGYVLVVNFGMDILTLAPELLDEKAKLFPELQFFVTQRVSDYHAWTRYINGVMIRGYGWSGCDGTVFLNEGELTPEEVRLGFVRLLPSEEAEDWSKYKTPDEEHVLELAAEWGVDPAFSNKNYQKGMGYICR